MDVLVHDEVKVALPEPRLLVLESKVQVWEHVQAWGEEGDLGWDDAQFSFHGPGWTDTHTHPHMTLSMPSKYVQCTQNLVLHKE